MANLTYTYNTDAKEWEVIDTNAGARIASFKNESVAANLAKSGNDSREALAVAQQQDINYSGGVQNDTTAPFDVNRYLDIPQDTKVKQTEPTAPFDVNRYLDIPQDTKPAQINTDSGVNYTGNKSLTQQEQEALVNKLNAGGPAPVSRVNDPLYAGGTRPATSEEATAAGIKPTTTVAPIPTEYTGYESTIPTEYNGPPQTAAPVDEFGGIDAAIAAQAEQRPTSGLTPDEVDAELAKVYQESQAEAYNPTDAELQASIEEAASAEGFMDQARQQQAISQQRRNVNGQDWRVRLRLAPKATYLYKAPNPGILQPLMVTDGVIFPYTPEITVPYRANYTPYDLTHANYRGYFYKNSFVDAITLTCPFTAQDTQEANYLLAVLTFFKSATKMFYGQDAERGSPPPLLYLTGHGEYQFNELPCLIQQFNMVLPPDVDYIRCGSPNNNQTNLSQARDRQGVIASGLFGTLASATATRIANSSLVKGAISAPPPPPTLGKDRVSYVPTKMNISLSLLPINSRRQMSQQFSLKQFASGDLIKGGFW